MTLLAGTRLGPYEIVAPLGAGGMGEVYRAKDTRLGRQVAIKVLPKSFSQDADRLRRFEQEARAVSALNHPNILTIHDVGEHDGTPYVVTELLEGDTLRGRMVGGAMSPRRALEAALQIAHGLAAAHERGIVHRDLKPENVFVTKDGRVKILDFGLAKLVEPRDSGIQTNLPTAAPATDPGMVLGTLGYMAPEQVRGRPADPRSDIFAFGAILYEMLAGRRAFSGDTPADTMSAILNRDVPELTASSREVTPGLDRVVRHCLEKDPERRFHSAHDLAFDLESLSDAVSGARPQPLQAPRPPKRAALAIGAAVLVLAAAAGVVLWRQSAHGGAAIDSIAVLPFSNASRNPETEYLSDGLTESVINSLSQLPGLRVAARSTVFHYKGRDDDPQKVARDLGVRAVVSGRVLQHGDSLSVQADLVDAANGSQIWGNRYERKLSDILAVQDEIARDISTKLRRRLSGEGEERLKKRSTADTEAYQLYLKGRYHWEKRTADDLRQAIDFFQKSIDRDPTFGLAYAGLADSYVVLPSYSIMAPAEAFPKAKAVARKALEIDDTLAAAHASLGLALVDWDHDWSQAEAEFKRSIEIDPNYATSRFWYSLMLIATGRADEAVAQIRKALDIDPFSAIARANLVRTLVFARKFEEAVAEGRKAVHENPNFPPAHTFLAIACEVSGLREEAAKEFRKAAEQIGPLSQGIWLRARAEALEGRRDDALRTGHDLEEMASKTYVSPMYLAMLYLALGQPDRAFEWLDRACEDRSYDVIYVGVDPLFDSIRNDPRFAEILRKANLTAVRR